MKKFILGFICGALLFSGIASYAATSIKTVQLQNGIKFNIYGAQCTMSAISITLDGEKSGSDYVPVKVLAEKMKAEVSYDAQRKIWFIKQPNKKQTPDGITQVTFIDGKYYIYWGSIDAYYHDSGIKMVAYLPDINDRKTCKYKLMFGNEMLLDNIPKYIEFDYYVNTMLPLIEGAL
jgi:hypothetical protein